jgi:hypothetical protein
VPGGISVKLGQELPDRDALVFGRAGHHAILQAWSSTRRPGVPQGWRRSDRHAGGYEQWGGGASSTWRSHPSLGGGPWACDRLSDRNRHREPLRTDASAARARARALT